MSITLYSASNAMAQRIALCVDDETGELDIEQLNAIETAFTEKSLAVVAVIKDKDLSLVAIDAHIAEVMAVKARLQRNQEGLKAYLQESMKMAGVSRATSDNGLLDVKLELERDESVELDEGATFPPELCNEPKPPTPSKTKIKAAILAGEPIAGAKIVKRDRLTIKKSK